MEARFVEAGEVGGYGCALQIECEVEGGQDLTDAENTVEVNGTDLCEFEGLLQRAGDEIVVPAGAAVRADGEKKSLGGTSFWSFVVEGYGSALVGAGDTLGPFVEEKAGMGVPVARSP